jgi:hypothetical protein
MMFALSSGPRQGNTIQASDVTRMTGRLQNNGVAYPNAGVAVAVGNIIQADADAICNTLKANGYPTNVIFRVMWEQNGTYINPAWDYRSGWTAAQYIANFQTAYTALKNAMPSCIVMWNPSLDGPQNSRPAGRTLYDDFPGQNFCDWVGFDGYDSYSLDVTKSQMNDFVNRANTVWHKPWAIGEWGIRTDQYGPANPDDPAYINFVASIATTANGCVQQTYYSCKNCGFDSELSLYPDVKAAYIAGFPHDGGTWPPGAAPPPGPVSGQAQANAVASVAANGAPPGAVASAVGSLASQVSTTGGTTLSVSPLNLGDLMVVTVETGAAVQVSSLSGGGVTTWTRALQWAPAGTDREIWYGTVTTTGASTITFALTGSTGTHNIEYDAQEYHTSVPVTWGLITSGQQTNASSTNMALPTLAPSTSNEVYVGLVVVPNTPTGGTTSGYMFTTTSWGNTFVSNADCTVAPQSPVATQNTAAASDTFAALFLASPVAASVAAAAPAAAGTVLANALASRAGSAESDATAPVTAGGAADSGSAIAAASTAVNAGGLATAGGIVMAQAQAGVNTTGMVAGTAPVVSAVGSLATINTTNAGTTLAVNPQNLGDVMVVTVETGANATLSSVSGGGVASWVKVMSWIPAGADREIWFGAVTAVGASTITFSWTGALGTHNVEYSAMEFKADRPVTWASTTSNEIHNTAVSTNMPMPSLTPAVSGELYVGLAVVATGPTGGTTPGYTFAPTAWGNTYVYNPACTSAAQAPVATQSAPGGGSDVLAVMIEATAVTAGVGTAQATAQAAVNAGGLTSAVGIAMPAASVSVTARATQSVAAGAVVTPVGPLATVNTTTGGTTLAVNPLNVGDLMVVTVETGANTLINTVSGGGVANWINVMQWRPGIVDREIWWGVVTTPGASTITFTWAASTGTHNVEYTAHEFQPDRAVTWGIVTSNELQNTTASTNMPFAGLVPTAAGEVFVGLAVCTQGPTGGQTTGYTFAETAWGNLYVYNANCTTAIQAPVATQTPAGGSDTFGALFVPSAVGVVAGAAEADGVASVAAQAVVGLGGSATATPAATVAAQALATAGGSATAASSASVNASALATATGTAEADAQTTVLAGGLATSAGIATAQAQASVVANWQMPAATTASVLGALPGLALAGLAMPGTIASGAGAVLGGLTAGAQASVTAQGLVTEIGTATAAAQSAVTAVPTLTVFGATTAAAAGAATASGVVTVLAAATAAAAGTTMAFAPLAVAQPTAVAQVRASPTLAVSGLGKEVPMYAVAGLATAGLAMPGRAGITIAVPLAIEGGLAISPLGEFPLGGGFAPVVPVQNIAQAQAVASVGASALATAAGTANVTPAASVSASALATTAGLAQTTPAATVLASALAASTGAASTVASASVVASGAIAGTAESDAVASVLVSGSGAGSAQVTAALNVSAVGAANPAGSAESDATVSVTANAIGLILTGATAQSATAVTAVGSLTLTPSATAQAAAAVGVATLMIYFGSATAGAATSVSTVPGVVASAEADAASAVLALATLTLFAATEADGGTNVTASGAVTAVTALSGPTAVTSVTATGTIGFGTTFGSAAPTASTAVTANASVSGGGIANATSTTSVSAQVLLTVFGVALLTPTASVLAMASAVAAGSATSAASTIVDLVALTAAAGTVNLTVSATVLAAGAIVGVTQANAATSVAAQGVAVVVSPGAATVTSAATSTASALIIVTPTAVASGVVFVSTTATGVFLGAGHADAVTQVSASALAAASGAATVSSATAVNAIGLITWVGAATATASTGVTATAVVTPAQLFGVAVAAAASSTSANAMMVMFLTATANAAASVIVYPSQQAPAKGNFSVGSVELRWHVGTVEQPFRLMQAVEVMA